MFFKAVKNGFNQARDMFKKSPEVVSNMFQKGRDIVRDISRGAGDASRILGDAAGVGQGILNSDTANTIMNLDPRLRRVGGLAQRGINGVNLVSNLSGQLSDFANERTYNGTHDKNLVNAIERARAIRNDANLVNYV